MKPRGPRLLETYEDTYLSCVQVRTAVWFVAVWLGAVWFGADASALPARTIAQSADVHRPQSLYPARGRPVLSSLQGDGYQAFGAQGNLELWKGGRAQPGFIQFQVGIALQATRV